MSLKVNNITGKRQIAVGGSTFMKHLKSGLWKYDYITNTLVAGNGLDDLKPVTVSGAKKSIMNFGLMWNTLVSHGYVYDNLAMTLTLPEGVAPYVRPVRVTKPQPGCVMPITVMAGQISAGANLPVGGLGDSAMALITALGDRLTQLEEQVTALLSQ